MEAAINSFKKYVANFDSLNPKVKLKIAHTMRTVNLAHIMAEKLKLSSEQEDLIKLIALLHDIGRFEQIRVQNSFADQSFDHALYGVRYLFANHHIRDFSSDTTHDKIISAAIYYHNKHVLDIPKLDPELMFYVRLIRDLDKIEIINTQVIEFPIYFDQNDVPESYYDDFNKKMLIRTTGGKNPSKSFLSICAYVNDINFPESYQMVRELGYWDKFFEKAVVASGSEAMYAEIKNKVYERIRENVR